MMKSDAYLEGAGARLSSQAFLSNPYKRLSPEWHDWRDGWMEEDAILRGLAK